MPLHLGRTLRHAFDYHGRDASKHGLADGTENEMFADVIASAKLEVASFVAEYIGAWHAQNLGSHNALCEGLSYYGRSSGICQRTTNVQLATPQTSTV